MTVSYRRRRYLSFCNLLMQRSHWAPAFVGETCPLTQFAFVRISSNAKIIPTSVSPRAAVKALGEMVALADHIFWADDLQVNDLASFSSNALVGHRQLTDAYLIELAKRHKGNVATLDTGLADLLPQAPRARFVANIGSA